MSSHAALRVMTYNIHSCVGRDGKVSPARVADVIGREQPDIVALQELDVGRSRTDRAHQPACLAERLGMDVLFHASLEFARDEHYGIALLSRHPVRLVQAGRLPTVPGIPDLERRGAMWAVVDVGGREVDVVNTHFGLNRRERLLQAEALLGESWLGPRRDPARPLLLCGDLNAMPGSPAYAYLGKSYRDAQTAPCMPRPRKTWPSFCPVLRIDHIFHSASLAVRGVRVPDDRLARLASDHLPVVADVALS